MVIGTPHIANLATWLEKDSSTGDTSLTPLEPTYVLLYTLVVQEQAP